MESIQSVKNRISSIGSTRQITQSMRLVSTAKVQRARNRMEQSRGFAGEMDTLLLDAAVQFAGLRHPYLEGNGSGTAAVVLVSSDRGLCGGYNIGVARLALEQMEELGDCRLFSVGVRGGDYCRRRGRKPERVFTGVSETPYYDDAREIAAAVLELYDRGEVGSVHLVCTRFTSLLVQTPETVRLLPLARPRAQSPELLLYEPEDSGFLERLAPFALASRIYGAMLESAACEQAARITSMDSAVKNADEMLESLTLLYNQARQGAITQEITEIVGGAEALSAKGE